MVSRSYLLMECEFVESVTLIVPRAGPRHFVWRSVVVAEDGMEISLRKETQQHLTYTMVWD